MSPTTKIRGATVFRWVGISAIYAALVFGGVYLAQCLRHGSAEAAWASLAGRKLLVTAGDPVLRKANGATKRVVIPVHVENLGGTPITITGVEARCNCVTVSDLPLEVGPLENKVIEISVCCAANGSLPEAQTLSIFASGAETTIVPVVLRGQPQNPRVSR